MFVFAFKAILRNGKLSPVARLLLLIIKSYGDTSGLHCYPSQDRLAADMGCSIPTIKRAVNELKRHGLISTEQRRNQDGKTSTTAYLLDDERRAKLAAPAKRKRKPQVTSDPPSGSPVIPGDELKVVPFTEETRCRL